MPRWVRSPGGRYGLALAAVAVAFALRLALDPLLGVTYPLLTVYAAAALCAWCLGPGPAVLVAVAGYLAAAPSLLDVDFAAMRRGDAVEAAVFIVLSATLIGLATAARRARREAAARQHEAETRSRELEALLQTAPGMAIATDPGLERVTVNPSLAALLGIPADQNASLSGAGSALPFSVMREGRELSAAEMPMQRAAATGARVHDGFTVVRADGRQVHLLAEAVPVRDRDGRVTGVVASHLDITAAVNGHRELEFALQAAEAALWSWDVGTGAISYSSNAAALYGLDEAAPSSHIDAVGRTIDPDDWRRVRAQLEAVRAGRRERYEAEFRIHHPARGVRWLRGIGRPQRDAAGRVVRIAGLNVDVTVRREAELALAAERTLLDRVQQAGRLGVFEWDVASDALRASDPLARLFGFEPSEAPARFAGWDARIHPDDRAAMAAARRACWSERAASCEHEFRVRLPDGGERWLQTHASYEYDADGTVRRCAGITLDIDARRCAELARQAGESRFRRLADAMPGIVFVVSADGADEYVSPRWQAYTGLERADPASMRSVVHPDDWERMTGAWRHALEARREFSDEFRLRRAADGAERWFLTRVVPMLDPAGAVERWVGVSTDIHEQKLALHALAESDRRKDAFLATLAHELRNPLAPIRYATRLLEPGTPAEMAAGARQMIDRQLAQMARLLDDLLDISRVTRGRLELRRETVDLGRIVRHAVEAARPAFEAARIDVATALPAEVVAVDGDPTRLQQLLGNLLSNAARYTEPGGRVAVALAADAAQARITVVDTGIGLAADQLELVFEPFTQFARGERMQGGLGIGLALARQLAELHGGRIRADSAGPGRGSTFVLELPRVTEPAAVEDSGIRRRPPVQALFGRQRRVLVADDNRDGARTLAAVLELAGYAPRVVHDGVAAIEAACHETPDVMLLDIGMPRLGGLDVARWVRGQPWGARTLLIAITGWGQEADRRASRAAGFDRHLTKPVDPDALLTELARHGGERGVERRAGDDAVAPSWRRAGEDDTRATS